MKSWILPEPGRLELIDEPVPDIKDDEVLVKLKWIGVCGSDVEILKGHRSPEFLLNPPRIGHEPSGIIAKVGRNVSGLEEGDHVSLRWIWGCFSEYVSAKPIFIKKLPKELPLIEGSVIEVIPGILKAIDRSELSSAKDVVILGQGVSGLLLTQATRLKQPHHLVTVDLFEEKLALSHELGATDTINVSKENLFSAIKKVLPDGADVVIPAYLDPRGVVEAVDIAKWCGKVVMYGCLGKCKEIDFFKLHRKRVDILTTTPDDGAETFYYYDLAIRYLLNGWLNSERLITHKFNLLDLPKAMELKSEPRGDVIHVMIDANLEA